MEDKLYILLLRYLTIRSRSEKEIRDYLKKQVKKPGISQAIADYEQFIEKMVSRLKSQKYIDDTEFAKMWIRSRLSHNPKGKHLIALELKQKGVSKDIIDETLGQKEEGNVDLENAKQLLEKNKRKYIDLPRQERFQKAGSMLARRGYDMPTIIQAIDAVFGK